MNKILIALSCFIFPLLLFAQEFKTPYEESGGTKSATLDQAIEFYEDLAAFSPFVKIIEAGKSDQGRPIHLVIIAGNQIFNPERKKANQPVILINNGIHAGESCGIDASMMLARDLITISNYQTLLSRSTILIIPAYNIGGSLNLSKHSRANQVGPDLQGFRANDRGLNLNRDFSKQESRNTKTFVSIFRSWKPDVFIDTHTTNGADYPYNITLITSPKDKLHPEIASIFYENMLPDLYDAMERAENEMTPYVNKVGKTPEEGISAFNDTPRYSSGYTSLFNCISMISEAHMLKTFEQRVEATYMLLLSLLKTTNKYQSKIVKAHTIADKETSSQSMFHLEYKLNTEMVDSLMFKGYKGKIKKSQIGNHDRLYYDQKDRYNKMIPYYNKFIPENQISLPKAYIIPQSRYDIIELLKNNHVKMDELIREVKLTVEAYQIQEFETIDSPYEGHYLHYDTKVSNKQLEKTFYPGDKVVYCNQPTNKFISETAEPQAVDSWFNWNLMDEILSQKEYFSPYLFEDTAAQMLNSNPQLQKEFDSKIASDQKFSENSWEQLTFIYKRSVYFEPNYREYPIYRYQKEDKLPIKR